MQLQQLAQVTCPWCFEQVEITLEADVAGQMDWDCEVCCRPWQLQVTWEGDQLDVDVQAG